MNAILILALGVAALAASFAVVILPAYIRDTRAARRCTCATTAYCRQHGTMTSPGIED